MMKKNEDPKPSDGIREIAGILAAGIIRMKQKRKEKSKK
jgi:hypothetical protein